MMNATQADWRTFIKRHWKAVTTFLVAAVLIFLGSIYVFLWYVSMAESSGQVPSTLGLWALSHIVTFIVFLFLWELVLVGIPTAIAVVLAWQLWWNKHPIQEKAGLKMSGRKRTAGGGGFSFLFFIVFAIKVYLDGKWNTPVANFTLDYFVSSVIAILLLGLLIVGVLSTIALAWWLRSERRRPRQ